MVNPARAGANARGTSSLSTRRAGDWSGPAGAETRGGAGAGRRYHAAVSSLAARAANETGTGAAGGRIDLRAARASVTSQDGENGVIDAIFRAIGTTSKVCVEFGAYNLRTYSNVFPLWSSQGWHAILIEGDGPRHRKLGEEYEGFRRESTPSGTVDLVRRFVAPSGPDSLDAILDQRLAHAPGVKGGPPRVDLVSIDIDGMDYHVWKGLTKHRPRVVIIEHNPSIPPHLAIHGPEEPNAVGASARALADLGATKGYALVCCTMCNCIFVEREHAGLFAHADDLEALFDRSLLCYALSTFDGGVALTHRPPWGFNVCSTRPGAMVSSVPLWQPPRSLLAQVRAWLRARRKGLGRVVRGGLAGLKP